MSVRPILLQKAGAIKGIPGAYRTSPPPIAGPYAGSDALEDVTYYTVNSSGEAELKTVKAYPFYVDSVSGGADTSGEGTPINPWRSVNHALAQLQPILACLSLKSCCTYLVLQVKGTVDYMVQYNNGSTFNGYNRFIIEPWNSDYINLNEYSGDVYAFFNLIYGVVFKNISIENSDNFYLEKYFYKCGSSTFNNINISVSISRSAYGSIIGVFSECTGSIFYKCNFNASRTVVNYEQSLRGFAGCDESIFYESNSNISSSAVGGYSIFYGYLYNFNSAFFSCTGEVSSEPTAYGCGFYGNADSTFLNCTGNSLNQTNCDI